MTASHPVAFLAALLLGSTFASDASAQTRPAWFDTPSTLTVVGTPAPDESLPVVVFLPATGGTSERMFELAREAIPFRSYVAMLPPGAPSSSDYLPNFSGFVSWMETRLLADLETAKTSHRVDATRVYLVGFSLGGDTAWALLARKPDVWRGAVVMGSRASARPSSTLRRVMHDRGCRVAFGMGNDDDASRVSGADRTYRSIRDAGIATEFVRYPGSHSAPDAATMRGMIAFVMNPPSP